MSTQKIDTDLVGAIERLEEALRRGGPSVWRRIPFLCALLRHRAEEAVETGVWPTAQETEASP